MAIAQNERQGCGQLYQKLCTLKVNQEVLVVTSLPSRFSEYTGPYARKRAKWNINAYLNVLNPSNFNCKFQPCFLFNNHAKVIATDTMAYFGSQNFSEASYDNFECGLVVKQCPEVQDFISKLIEEMSHFFVAYPGTDKSRFDVLLAGFDDSVRKLKEHMEGWFEEVPDLFLQS